jgi:SAM-dependent methyltransferase
LKNRSSVSDPVDAYNEIAPYFAQLSAARSSYLDRIESLVAVEIPAGARSLLDIGSGDGVRCLRIARASGIGNFVLLEPSPVMRSLWPPGTCGWPIRAEELNTRNGQFDAITCLWNVLGHIFPAASRVEVLRQCARLLSPGGRLFIDVSHRYNVIHYGILPTLLRAIRDLVLPNERNGDVTAHWDEGGTRCATKGHVFTDAEFRRNASVAGLSVLKCFAVDYLTGSIRRSICAGHLFYVLSRRAP